MLGPEGPEITSVDLVVRGTSCASTRHRTPDTDSRVGDRFDPETVAVVAGAGATTCDAKAQHVVGVGDGVSWPSPFGCFLEFNCMTFC